MGCGRCGLSPESEVREDEHQARKHRDNERRADRKTENDGGSQRPLKARATADPESERAQRQNRDQRGHQNRPQSRLACMQQRFRRNAMLICEFSKIEYCELGEHANDHCQAHERRNVQFGTGDPQAHENSRCRQEHGTDHGGRVGPGFEQQGQQQRRQKQRSDEDRRRSRNDCFCC